MIYEKAAHHEVAQVLEWLKPTYVTEKPSCLPTVTWLLSVLTLVSFVTAGALIPRAIILGLLSLSGSTQLIKSLSTHKQQHPEITCGDIVHLSAGDTVLADVRLIETKDFLVSECPLTGDNTPLPKHSNIEDDLDKSPWEYGNLAFRGSIVLSGEATGVVLKDPDHSLFESN